MEFKLVNENGEEFVINAELMKWVMSGISEIQDLAIDRDEEIASRGLGEFMKFVDESRYPQLRINPSDELPFINLPG